ncbi:cytochrome b/b6 domain-containing protein [Rhodoferax sp.]|jgi:thiosulfate reductase cytochrome b subunit|uniref:cytochrome b/b6 domain-containing protein n=1 Tax=Rhodoferax sp. TaxID=50421 RepID=UPI00271908E3|nr:cytochrome b/b6 domain-containing protein [Rhodoferax sp.]MDO9144794.1 cytochrome b/b6 domain-containing protein [Rhodoferax sp.]MDP1530662.1 cytochrome b/b6 domain-containing protein [Rhodoferax sp.]MDP1944725.1 cytochrome b/b6 domain-containing protein [Rhodoferax sp.]MDP2443586.1 cytochrome b/b6 domain-containing protein [Rhodoferax sp.]MDP3189941.1 cytochrome b/b6 domain-containing protein [Rhodoferax sp.]
MARVYLFKPFERFWHWCQAALIIFMLLTGFEVHGTYSLFGFEKAVAYHTIAAWTLVGLWIFAIFWHVTSGEWRHYIPTTHNIFVIAKYYSSGIFKDEPHPFRPSLSNKHNPLQRLTYLAVLTLLSPLLWLTGWLYLFYADWQAWGLGKLQLQWIATSHTLGAFLMLAFLISHLYLATTGHKITSQVKAMITGWEDLGDDAAPGKKH